ncbi:unnamed protein product [Colias eurytheme]|nr:unnamed protein product [Colias eurytheme]
MRRLRTVCLAGLAFATTWVLTTAEGPISVSSSSPPTELAKTGSLCEPPNLQRRIVNLFPAKFQTIH